MLGISGVPAVRVAATELTGTQRLAFEMMVPSNLISADASRTARIARRLFTFGILPSTSKCLMLKPPRLGLVKADPENFALLQTGPNEKECTQIEKGSDFPIRVEETRA